MAKKILIISISLRGGSNSDILARECERGAKAQNGLWGWVDCFEKAQLKGIVTGGGITDPNDASNHKDTL